MSTDTNVKQVIINKLTKAQYDAATKSATELYLTPDDPASTTNLGPVMVDGDTIKASSDGTIFVDQTRLTTKQNSLSNMTVAEGTTGTATTQRSVRADYLKDIINYYITEQPAMTGATSSANGTKGAVPAPSSGDQDKFLKGDGTWSPVSGGSSITADGTTIVNNSGTISTVAIKEQRASTVIKEWVGTKAQYDAISTKDTNTKYVITDDYDSGIVVDNALSTTSANPVENRVITNAIQNMATAKTRFTGEIIESTVPLTDAGLHLLDGSVIIGNGSYAAFVTYMANKYITNPEIFCTETEWQQSITDYGVCNKFVYSSSDNSVRLPKIERNGHNLIQTYKNGYAWYNIYSDGWCEQGNIENVPSAGATVTLVKEFIDTNYNVVTSGHSTKYGNTTSYDYTTTDFKAWTSDDESFNAAELSWTAYGYVDISTLKLNAIYQYIVIANIANTQVEVDINEVFSDLNGKVDRTDLSEVQCIVETYHNGTSWYRVYSDGWCEQGGKISIASHQYGYTEVALLKTMIDTNYTITIGGVNATENGNYTFGVGNNSNITTSSFRIWDERTTGSNHSNYCYWMVAGYII